MAYQSRLRQKKKGSGIHVDLGAILSAIGGVEGGGVEAIPPSDVPHDDPSFDARTQTRFKPKSGAKDFLSGGRATRTASNLNAQQILADQEIARQLSMQKQSIPLDIERETALSGVRAKADIDKEINLGPIQTANKVAERKAIDPLDEAKAAHAKNAELLVSYGIPVNPKNLATVDSTLTELKVASEVAKTQAGTLSSMNQGEGSRLNLDIRAKARPELLNTGINQAQLEQMQSQANLSAFPAETKVRAQMLEREVQRYDAVTRNIGAMEGYRSAQEQKLTQLPLVERLLQEQQTKTGVAPKAPPVSLTPQPANDDYIVIDGIMYKKPKQNGY